MLSIFGVILHVRNLGVVRSIGPRGLLGYMLCAGCSHECIFGLLASRPGWGWVLSQHILHHLLQFSKSRSSCPNHSIPNVVETCL